MKNSKLQERMFQSHMAAEKVTASRTLCLFGALLYLIFAVADLYSLSVSLKEVLVIRGLIVVGMLAAVAVSYSKIFIKYYDLTLSIVYLLAAAGIEIMIYLAAPEDHASQAYFAGLILVIMTVFAWAYFKIETSVLIIVTIIATYSFIGVEKNMALPGLLVNIFFLFSAAAIGFITKLIRDRHIRDNFFLQQSLKSAIAKKTKEADDNAYIANHDALTLLPNRRYITELLEESLTVAKKNKQILAVLFLDLNGFKQVNDIYGHAVGDEVLVIVAKRLEMAVRKGDYLSRLGGDEFLVSLMMDKDSTAGVETMAEKFTTIISKPMRIDGIKIKVGVSVGIAAYPMHGNKVKVLLEIADKKMYTIKNGRSTTEARDHTQTPAVTIFPGNIKQRSGK